MRRAHTHTHTHTHTGRQAETQAEGEAGSMQGAQRGTVGLWDCGTVGLNPGSPESRPGLKAVLNR